MQRSNMQNFESFKELATKCELILGWLQRCSAG
jgi:hypothetical protein